MVKSSSGLRSGTRKKFRKDFRSKFTVTPYIREFATSDKVVIDQNPASQKNLPHYRFKGLNGVVKGKRGRAYLVEVMIGNRKKTLIARPEHLLPVTAESR